MRYTKSLPNTATISERIAALRTKLNVDYDLGPISPEKYQHDRSKRMYCDILGCEYCQTCCEESLREANFVRSITDAESYISRVTSPSRIQSTIHSLRTVPQADNTSDGLLEEDRVDNIVNNIFPTMYRSLSLASSKMELYSMGEDSGSNIKQSSTGRHRSMSGATSTASINSLDSTENFGDDERSLSNETGVKPAPIRRNHIENGKQELPAIRRKINDGFSSSNTKGFVTDDTTNEDDDRDYFDEDTILDLKRESPSKSYHQLVRRSSVVAKQVRDRTNERIKVQIAKWTPPIVEEYPRGRNAFKRSSIFAQQKRENTFYSKQATAKAQSPSSQISSSYLEKLRQPKFAVSLLPMEPVMCGVKYMKNRWRDEAMYKNNSFAIKLNLLRT